MLPELHVPIFDKKFIIPINYRIQNLHRYLDIFDPALSIARVKIAYLLYSPKSILLVVALGKLASISVRPCSIY